MDAHTDRLLTYSFLQGAIALGSWFAYVTTADDPRVWLAVAMVATVGCAATKLQATLRELQTRLLGARDAATDVG